MGLCLRSCWVGVSLVDASASGLQASFSVSMDNGRYITCMWRYRKVFQEAGVKVSLQELIQK